MSSTEKVLELLGQQGGYLTSTRARESKIDNKTLQRMTNRNQIERVAHGLYVDVNIMPDRFYIAQYRCPKGVFSHDTALFLHDLSDRDPLRLTMTIPSGWNSQLLTDANMIFFYCEPKRILLGAREIETTSGVRVNVYDVERTLCDCLKNIDKLDRDLVLTALKRYASGNNRDNAKLLEYANSMKIRDIVYRYLEVLE
ncbi:MAG: type IV toxin-antitoxin system AbiEi family antitoxin domain-containing protein [Oscillospiraceae bacterium]|nr:type IV toxin-antitoxin system AbiEi family antitoxin domain-containing protein [Oscillospiraceae bacterium]